MAGHGARSRLGRLAAILVGLAIAAGLVLITVTTATGADRQVPVTGDIGLPVPTTEASDGPAVVPPPDQPTSDRPNLTTLSGVLQRCGPGYCVHGAGVDFGPPWHLERTTSPADLDRDGQTESLAAEISGLVDQTVTLTVEYGRTGEPDVYAIDGVFFRDEIGPPPWAGGPPWADGPPRAGPR